MLKRVLLISILVGLVSAQGARVSDYSTVFERNAGAGLEAKADKNPGDIALLSIVSRALPLLKPGVYDTLNVQIRNAGSSVEDSVVFIVSSENGLVLEDTVIVYTTLNPGDTSVVQVPYQIGTSLGIDTLSLVLGDDDDPSNNGPVTHYIEVWDDSTVAATSFSESPFPLGWTRGVISDPYYNWERTTSGTYPTISPLDAPAMAMYPSYSTSSGEARLISPVINLDSAKKVILRFYMVHDNGYSSSYDSIYVEYSTDGVNFNTVQGFQRYDASVADPTWMCHEVEVGDFPDGTELYVALRAKSRWGNNMFVDSVWAFATAPTSPDTDAQILSISIPKPVIQNDNNFVTVCFKNSGLDPITNIELYYTLGGTDTTWETWNGSLTAGASEEYTFTTPLMPSDTGEFNIYAGVKLAGDAIPENDTTSATIHVWPYAQDLPYAENFDEDWSNSTNPPYGGWKIIDGGDETPPVVNGNDWHRYVSSSRTVASVYWSPTEHHDDWLISPRLRIMGYGTYTLNFWHYYNDYNSGSPDSGQVLISFDDGETWTEITRYSNADDSGNVSLDITSYIAPQVETSEYFRIAFHYGAYDEMYWNVDDFSVTYEPDTTPPVVEMIRGTQDSYDTTSDTVILAVSDLSPFHVYAFAVVNDSIIVEYDSDCDPGTDTITVEIPGAPQGTVYDGYIYVEDASGNSSLSHGTWWKLYAFTPGTPTLTPISEPQKGVRLTWAKPGEELSYCSDPAWAWSGIGEGDVVSVRFTPQYVPARIDGVVALFYGTSGDMHLKIYDDNDGVPGNVLFDTLITVPVSPTILDVDLRDKNIIVNGEYHIGFEWTVADQPYPISDDTASTDRSLYYDAPEATWYIAGYDWVINSSVTYFPQSKAYAGKFVSTALRKDHNLKKVSLPQIALKEEKSAGTKYIEKYIILRATTSGGPYDAIDSTANNFYEDYILENDTTYYYVVRMDYLSPDTMTYSDEVSITADFVGPEFSIFDYDSGGVGNIWVSVDIVDPSGIYADTLYYSVNGGDFVAAVHDSISGSTYYYTISGLNVGDNVDLYFVALDNSPWYNVTRYPESDYISFLVTSVTDERPTMYAFDIKGSNIVSRGVEFAYALPERTEVEISVYSVIGQRIATLVKGKKDAGYYRVRWNGTDEWGSRVGSGVYIVKMETPKKSFSKRIILTR